jgi:hypothetical protein
VSITGVLLVGVSARQDTKQEGMPMTPHQALFYMTFVLAASVKVSVYRPGRPKRPKRRKRRK